MVVEARGVARAAALDLVRRQFDPSLSASGLASLIRDTQRAERIAGNVERLIVDVAGADGPLIRRVESRLTMIGVSENASAYNDERRNAMREFALADNLVEVWDATLDKRTCPTCYEMHGTEAVGGAFPGGLVPGGVHPSCRCTSFWRPRRR